jgi:hypothetical protein
MDSLDEKQSFTTLLQSGLQNYNETPSQPKMKSTKKSNFSISSSLHLIPSSQSLQQ